MGKRGRPRGVQTSTVKQSAAASTSRGPRDTPARSCASCVRGRVLGRAPCARWRGGPARPDARGCRGHPDYGCRPPRGSRGHPDDEPADRVHAPWAARSATAAAVVCPRDQLSMPAAEGLGRDQGVPVTAYPSPEARGLGGQAPARGVGDPETARTALLSEDAMLCLERVNDVTRLLADPARDGHDEELQHLGKGDIRGEPSRGSRRSRTSRPGERPA